jgi:hypothetical protein
MSQFMAQYKMLAPIGMGVNFGEETTFHAATRVGTSARALQQLLEKAHWWQFSAFQRTGLLGPRLLLSRRGGLIGAALTTNGA